MLVHAQSTTIQKALRDQRNALECARPLRCGSARAQHAGAALLLYADHDVQPADGTGWHSPLFEPTLRAHDGRPPVGVTVFIEGEEERLC
jgi:acetylornithine deacetylase/succinyl-diaminopimelate desuccinylase-like protein